MLRVRGKLDENAGGPFDITILNQSSDPQLRQQKNGADLMDYIAFQFGGSEYLELNEKPKDLNTEDKVKEYELTDNSREQSKDSAKSGSPKL